MEGADDALAGGGLDSVPLASLNSQTVPVFGTVDGSTGAFPATAASAGSQLAPSILGAGCGISSISGAGHRILVLFWFLRFVLFPCSQIYDVWFTKCAVVKSGDSIHHVWFITSGVVGSAANSLCLRPMQT